MDDTPSTERCPECDTLVHCPGGKTYGVHFARAMDAKPCRMSFKTIVAKPLTIHVDQDPGDE